MDETEDRLLLVDLLERLVEVDSMLMLNNTPDLGCFAPGRCQRVELGLVAGVPGRRARRMNQGARSGTECGMVGVVHWCYGAARFESSL